MSRVLIAGGGLQGALVALALAERRPELELHLVERAPRLGGAHTWCFHAADVPAAARAFVEPLVEHRWPGYDVRFPGEPRRVEDEYAGLSSAWLDRVVRARFEGAPQRRLWLDAPIAELGPHFARLEDGRRLEAELVIDARGSAPGPPPAGAGFQKFVGQELELAEDHGLERPIVMDATVEQQGGYRFFYVLPFGPRRVLVEDTRFSDSPALDRARLEAEVARYAAASGLRVARVLRTEEGVLPMPWRAERRAPAAPPFALGYRGGWLHPATGYSFPLAARLALLVAERPEPRALARGLDELARSLRGQLAFARLLNRLLFRWFLPEDRREVFARFYRMPQPTVRRFYALRSTALDRLRLVGGRPPRGFSLRARLTAGARELGAPRVARLAGRGGSA